MGVLACSIFHKNMEMVNNLIVNGSMSWMMNMEIVNGLIVNGQWVG